MDTKKTLTRADIAEAVVNRFKISRFDAAEIVEAILEEISESLHRGEEVKLARFGTFYIRDKKERMGRNPKTREDAVISARKSVTFRASPVFKEIVSKGAEADSWVNLGADSAKSGKEN